MLLVVPRWLWGKHLSAALVGLLAVATHKASRSGDPALIRHRQRQPQ